MKFRNCVLFNAILFIVLATASTGAAGEYKIGAGDLLDISVWKNADLSRQLIVLPDGSVRFPLIGQLEVEGKSAGELEKELIEKLEKYVPDPILSVSIIQVGSMAVYVIGKVNHPGRFSLNDDIDVLHALAIAGGLNAFAREKEIVIHRKINGETTIFNFNYKEVSEGKNLNQNIMLQRGDVIVVR